MNTQLCTTTTCPQCHNRDCEVVIYYESTDASEPGGESLDFFIDGEHRCDRCGHTFTDKDAQRIGQGEVEAAQEDMETADVD